MRLAATIVHQTQPTDHSCTATCIAMAIGVPVAELGVDLDRPYGFEAAAVWLAERGIWLRVGLRIGNYGERLESQRLYLVGIRSQNKIGTDHAVLLDTRGDVLTGPGNYERSHWKTYDPNMGREGKKWIAWIDELGLLDFAELIQRDRRFRQFGEAPDTETLMVAS